MSPPPPSGALAQSVEATVRSLRAALLDLYADVGADPATPQEVSRQYGVTKSQAWKLAKVMGSSDPLEAARYLPGRRGLERVLEALARHDPNPALVAKARAAMDEFHAVISTHAGDRATFERTLDSMRADSDDPAAMESSRKLSFLGNSATWGIQARVRLGVRVLVPNADDSEVFDIANVSGLLDLQRLRSTARWPVAQYSTYFDHDAGTSSVEPLFPLEADDAPPFVSEFCSTPRPPIRLVPLGSGVRFDLDEGPVGKAAKLSCLFGLRYNRFPAVASEPGEVATHAALLRTPVELVLSDLLIHRDLPLPLPPTAQLFSQMETDREVTAARLMPFTLPLPERVEHLGSAPPMMATPHDRRHGELVTSVVDRMGCSLDDFTAYRIVLRYPPIPTMLCLQHPLLQSAD